MTDDDLPDRHDLGVLFVHGIGEQREGRTLVSFTAAMYAWLARWDPSSVHGPGPSALADVVLTPSTDASAIPHGPAHGSLHTRLGVAGPDAPARRWLLAESWWAEVFDPPRFLDLARWLWKISTCLLVLQFLVPLRRHWDAARRPRGSAAPAPGVLAADSVTVPARLRQLPWVATYLILMGVSAVLSVPLAIGLLALAGVSRLPIPRADEAVQWVVVHLSAIVGDSYVLVRCPVEYAAMRTQVARDLQWLQQRCERVVLVAHSQGAAIAHQVLKDSGRDTGNLTTFITVGQGIAKLHLLKRMSDDTQDPALVSRTSRARRLVVAGLLLTSTAALNLIAGRDVWWFVRGLPPNPAVTQGSTIAVGLILLFCGIRTASRAVGSQVADDLTLAGAGMQFRWIDYFASADPVSNGALVVNAMLAPTDGTSGAVGAPAPGDCRRVCNMASAVSDHTRYLSNQSQFVSWLMNDLVSADAGTDDRFPAGPDDIPARGVAGARDGRPRAASGGTAPPLLGDALIDDARRRRHRLIDLLIGARLTALVAGILTGLTDPAPAVRRTMERIESLLSLPVVSHDLVLRSIAAALVSAAVYAGAMLVWHACDRRSTMAFFHTARHPWPAKPPAASMATEDCRQDSTVSATVA